MAQNRFVSYFVVLGIGESPKFHSSKASSPGDEGVLLLPLLEDRYPYEDYPDGPLPELLPMFCFPCGARASTTMLDPTFFSFILTELSGEKFYVSCLTFYQEVSETQLRSLFFKEEKIETSGDEEDNELSLNPSTTDSLDTSFEEKTLFAPRCICILSKHPHFSTFRECLRELFTAHRSLSSIPMEHYVSYLIYDIPLPPPGYSVEFQLHHKKITFSTPQRNFFSLMEFSGKCLFDCLGVNGVLEIFSYVLSEQKIIFCSKYYNMLTIAAETIIKLIFPFEWHHIFIPILPFELLDFLEAPTPFIVGVHSKLKEKVLEYPGIVIVDLDNKTISSTFKTILPPIQTQILKSKLNAILHPQLQDIDLAFPKSTALPYSSFTFPSNNAMQSNNTENFITTQIRFTFLQFFIDIFKNFRNYISFLRKFPEPVTIFNKAKYIKDNHPTAVEFLTMFLETQAFSMFLYQHQEFSIFEVVIRAQKGNIPISAIWNVNQNLTENHYIKIPPLPVEEEDDINHSQLQSSLSEKKKKALSTTQFPNLRKGVFPQKQNTNYFENHNDPILRQSPDQGNIFAEIKNTSGVEGSSSNHFTDPAQQFIEDTLGRVLNGQIIPNESVVLLTDLVKLEPSRLVVTKYLLGCSDLNKGGIIDLNSECFNFLANITKKLLEEAKISNDFASPAILIKSSGSFRLNGTDQFLHSTFRQQAIFLNKYFWEATFFESVARERELLPDVYKVGLPNSLKWEDLPTKERTEMETKEANLLFGVLGSFSVHMVNIGISAKEASSFLQQMSRLCDLAQEQVQELETLVTHMQQIYNMMNESEVKPNSLKHNSSNSNFKVNKQDAGVKLQYFATSSSNDFDSKSLYRRLMEQKVKRETQQYYIERDKANGFRTLRGHKKGISSMAIQYPLLAVASVNGELSLWNLNTNEYLEFPFDIHKDKITTILFSGKQLICSSQDSTISVWNNQTGELESHLKEHNGSVNSISISNNKLVSCSDDSTIKVWDTKTWERLATLTGHSDSVLSVKIENSFIVSGSKDKTVKIWDSQDFECKYTLSKHKDWVKIVNFTDNYINTILITRTVSASYDNSIIIWDKHTGQHIHTLLGHTGTVNCIDINGKILASGSSDSSVRIWNMDTGEELGVFSEEEGDEITCVIIDPHFSRLISGGFDCMIRIWDLNSGAKIAKLSGHTDWVYALILHLIDNHSLEKKELKEKKDKEKKDKEKDKEGKKEKKEKEKKEKKEKVKVKKEVTWLLISGSWDNSVKVWEQTVNKSVIKKSKKRKIAKLFTKF